MNAYLFAKPHWSDFVLRRRARLDASLRASIPRRSKNALLIATWNLREFDTLGYGVRSDECLGYIAQVISSFELVALQEVREDLLALRRLMTLLGPHWSFRVTDVTVGPVGNGERLADVYDARKVRLGGLVGDIVLPDSKRQFARTPFTVGFEALGTSLQLCTVHVSYGVARAVDPRRLAEVRSVAEWLATRAKEASAWSPNVSLLGDFNIFRRTDVTYGAITGAGFAVPEALQALPGSNVPKNKLYDQMALAPAATLGCTGRAGVFDYYDSVYRERDERHYRAAMGEPYLRSKWPEQYYRTKWRTFQMSDHLPMWMQVGWSHTADGAGGSTGAGVSSPRNPSSISARPQSVNGPAVTRANLAVSGAPARMSRDAGRERSGDSAAEATANSPCTKKATGATASGPRDDMTAGAMKVWTDGRDVVVALAAEQIPTALDRHYRVTGHTLRAERWHELPPTQLVTVRGEARPRRVTAATLSSSVSQLWVGRTS